jgi:hypothetical protein
VPECIKRCRAFARPNPPTGSTEKLTEHTGNALVRRAVVADRDSPVSNLTHAVCSAIHRTYRESAPVDCDDLSLLRQKRA